MYKRLINYVEKKSILYDKQFGFRTNHSTIQAILLLTDIKLDSKSNRRRQVLMWNLPRLQQSF